MRLVPAFMAGALLICASAASAETRVFIIANHPDGYGVDQCLAKGDKCGAHAARSYCQSRDFAQASNYRRVDPDEIIVLRYRTGDFVGIDAAIVGGLRKIP